MAKFKYIGWIDSWRGVLIFLVVLGHAIGSAAALNADSLGWMLERVRNSIYIFHMPAFFCLAGVVWKCDNAFFAFVKKKLFRLIVPYFVFGVFSSIIYLMTLDLFKASVDLSAGGYYSQRVWGDIGTLAMSLLHGGGGPDGFRFRMNGVLWFLPCMFSVCIVYFWIDKLFPAKRQQCVVFVAASIIAALVARFPDWILPWGLMRVPNFIGYMILGRWFIPTREDAYTEKRKKIIYTLLFAVFVLFCTVAPNPWWGSVHLGWHLAFKAASILGILASCYVAVVVHSKIWMCLGGMSMTIMLLHKFPLLMLQFKIPFLREILRSNVSMSLIGCTLISALSISICCVAHILLSKFLPWSIGLNKQEKK